LHKLLIVDDEEAMRRLLRIHLQDRYVTVDTGDPGQALAIALRDKPDAILLDLRMPNHSGFELCRTFNSLTFTQLIPIVIVTGEAGAATRSLCKEIGAKAYFEKPVDFDALRSALESLLYAVRPERRSEVRIRLRVKLALRGTDLHGNSYEAPSATENVSRNGFLCVCTTALRKGSPIAVNLVSGQANFSGKAELIWSEGFDGNYREYGFRFIEKTGDWILR
jgi:DNA-binding response OmpR family regulator